jgi:hypothetical protein
MRSTAKRVRRASDHPGAEMLGAPARAAATRRRPGPPAGRHDTPEAHDEISPRDLPADHPGRQAAERQAQERGGATPGHRQGGAADRDADLVQRDERESARFRR